MEEAGRGGGGEATTRDVSSGERLVSRRDVGRQMDLEAMESRDHLVRGRIGDDLSQAYDER